MNVSGLCTYEEIANELNVSRATVRKWRARHDDFPRPAVSYGNNAWQPLWRWNEVRQWAIATYRYDDVVGIPTPLKWKGAA